MREFYDVITGHGIRAWLAMSAVLGIHRDGKLLKRDEDVDFYCCSEELIPVAKNILRSLLVLDYDVRLYGHKARLMAYKNGEEMALMGHRIYRKKYRKFKSRVVPAEYFSTCSIEYNGTTYRCAGPTRHGKPHSWGIEKYLEWQYLNWRKPYRGNPEDRDKYMNKAKVRK